MMICDGRPGGTLRGVGIQLPAQLPVIYRCPFHFAYCAAGKDKRSAEVKGVRTSG